MDKFDLMDAKGQGVALQFIGAMFSAQTINYNQHFEDKYPVDIHLTATTKNNNEHWYAVECKHRDYRHNQFKDGWIIERHKIKDITKESAKGYRPCYLCTFNDGYCAVWDLSKINWDECGKTGLKDYFNTEVERNAAKMHRENKITLKIEQAVWLGKMNDGKIERCYQC